MQESAEESAREYAPCERSDDIRTLQFDKVFKIPEVMSFSQQKAYERNERNTLVAFRGTNLVVRENIKIDDLKDIRKKFNYYEEMSFNCLMCNQHYRENDLWFCQNLSCEQCNHVCKIKNCAICFL